MSIARELNRSQRELERALDRPTFTWNAATYACTANASGAGKSLETGGWLLAADLVLFARTELFPADGRPTAGTKLTYAGDGYKIENIAVLPGTGLLKIFCASLTKGI